MALVLGGMIATPLVHPPELKSISETVGRVDRSTMPALQRFSARDGTELAYRHYPARATPVGKIAILVHGSSGSSVAVHALADGLAAHGIDTFAPDIRGHGGSGTRGDIGYLGQLEDDLADLVTEVRKSVPAQPIVLLGHSAGGGFALRAASAPIQDLFARTILLSPYLGYDAPTNRDNSGGWASPDIPRILALGLLSRIGVSCCEALPALAFAVRPNSEKYVASTYSYRLLRNFATRGYKPDLTAAKHPVTLIAGADDELMQADKYADAVHAVAPAVDVRLIPGVNHMEIVSAPQAVSAIAEDVATR
ncbi:MULTISPECIES: alpha/beta hydrolase [Bradyrhizobium]|uniref:Alpha/beta hydrolase n=2 Tax=Bradyrhizobium TaxID=374 RepID=A0ABS5G698_9BRAD|nr:MULTISPECIES: alpha/beta hydrolase [Bradyrhizobium]MBR1136569.1 alpha/beta hydrolase [Bradyrhizobium denitrificans]MDU1494562.1 alpha/beta hydrolase [Bradyrhizobium sp.]MDU1544720.1 alpha/beta hydrolase [Bradyrhizobium sp.]MDU1690705.1 alpha/beta hydrolase [Bradyrhizobium sp.]MDU1808805.1 alpha/beta hydrolase [Bradyrhizobium sp.]